MTIETYTCKCGTGKICVGTMKSHEVYCTNCKCLIFSVEETTKQEMKLNKSYMSFKN